MANPFLQFAPDSGGQSANPFRQFAPLAQPATFDREEDEQLYRQTLAEIEQQRSKPQAPFRVSGPDGKEIDLNQIPANELAIQLVEDQRAQEAEQQDFDASRTPLKRITDTSTFALSAIPRALTGGRHGLGDVAGLASEEAGDVYTQAEQDFVRANRGWLEPVAQAGEAAIGIPLLQSMGAVPGQMLRTARAATSPAAMRTAPRQSYNWARSRVGMPPTQAPPPRPSPPRAPQPQATPAQAYGPSERIADRAAFRAEGIPEFPPAFASTGTARVARTIEEFPFVGGTVRVPKNATEQAMAARQGQMAQQLGAAASPEDAGLIAQRGLNRFRTSELSDLERDVVQRMGISPTRSPQATAGTVNVRPGRLNTAQLTDDQLDLAASSRVSLPESLRTTVDDLSPDELRRVVARPARDTSFATRSEALYKQAHDSVPQMRRANDTVNPGRLALRNSRNAADDLIRQERRSSISGGVLEGRFGPLVERMRNPSSHMSLDEMRAARTEIGRALSNYGQFDVRLDRAQLKRLYAAISDDYQSGLVALAARARQRSRLSQNHPSYVEPSVANAADRALQQYRRADRYYRAGVARMDRFMNVLGAKTLEQASQRIARYLRENTQDIRSLETMAQSLRPEEWRGVLGHVIENLGRITPGARQAERIFSFERFATDWNKVSQNPRILAMMRRSLGDEVVQSLNNMGRIAERMKRYEQQTNFSGTAYTAFGGFGLATLYNPANWPALVGSIVGAGLTGKLLTSRAFASWVNSLNQAQVRVGSSIQATRQAARPHIQRLIDIAKREPDPEMSAAMAAFAFTIDQQLNALDEMGARQ